MLWRQFCAFMALLIVVQESNATALVCTEDNECPKGQYCYMKRSCASFTNCTVMFNRRETNLPARDAHQCGDCIDGFVEDEYINGERPDKCKSKTEIKSIKDNKDNTKTPSYNLKRILFIVGGLIVCGIVCALGYWFWRKRSNVFNGCCRYKDHHSDINGGPPEDQCGNNINMLLPIPSAPLDETNLFGDEITFPKVKAKVACIEAQCATAFIPPSYVNHANYGTNEIYHSIDDTDAAHQETIPLNTSNNNNESCSTDISVGDAANTENNYSDNAQYNENNTSFGKQNIVVSQTNYINFSL